MPIPRTIASMNQAAYNCANVTFTFANPKGGADYKGTITRAFHSYLEIGMQSKHDAIIRSHCNAINVVSRRAQDTQINHRGGQTAHQVLTGYYSQCGIVGAEVARDDMIRRWNAQPLPLPNVPRTPVFTPETRVDAPVQKTLQRNNHYYDLSYWVQSDGVWVLFHCYPDA